MSETQPDPAADDTTPDTPTGKQSRDARRHAHGVQRDSTPDEGGDKKARKGRSDPRP